MSPQQRGTLVGRGVCTLSPMEVRPAVTGPSPSPDEDDADVRALERFRAGDSRAFEELFERHVEGARRLARSMLRDQQAAEDAVAEAFTSTYAAIQRGRGPVDGFERYLRRSVRHQCLRTWRRQARQRPTDDLTLDGPQNPLPVQPDGRDEWLDVSLLRGAFRDLPPRMQLVLWRTEVEGRSHADVADQLHTTPAAVAALAMRSRRELARHYLQRHVAPPTDRAGTCRAVRTELAGAVRDTLTPRRQLDVDEHLASCAECRSERRELELVNHRLRVMPLGPALAASKLSTFASIAGRLGFGVPSAAAVVPAAVGGMAAVIGLSLVLTGDTPTSPERADAAGTTVVTGVSGAGRDPVGTTVRSTSDSGSATADVAPGLDPSTDHSTPTTVAIRPTAAGLSIPLIEPLMARLPLGPPLSVDLSWALGPRLELGPRTVTSLGGAMAPLSTLIPPVSVAPDPVNIVDLPVDVPAPLGELVEPAVVEPVIDVLVPVDAIVDVIDGPVDLVAELTDQVPDLLGT